MIEDYKFYRYLGTTAISSNGVTIKPRDVVGLIITSSVAYAALPSLENVVAIDVEVANAIVEEGREFTANPAKLFSENFNFNVPNAGNAPVKPVPKPLSAPTAYPSKVNAEPKETVRDVPPETEEVSNTKRAQELQDRDNVSYKDLKPLKYSNTVYTGGTQKNYATQKLEKCGKVHLEVQNYSDFVAATRSNSLNVMDCQPYVMADIQSNVMPAIGLKVPLPFKRLYVGIGTQADGCYISTTRTKGVLYGVIVIDPKQIIRLLGGFNSKSVAHVITHELAHFIDHTMIRNLDRLKFQKAIAGKDIHPIRNNGGGGKNNTAMEHFATLAELMVWGDSLRKVYVLNGIEVVEKYFVNRFIPESDIESRKI